MVVLVDNQGLLGIVEKSQLTANGLDYVRLRPCRFDVIRRD